MFDLPENIISALSLLRASGFTGYIVGGCVRDMLMGREANDWDITTNAEPEKVKEVFRDFRVIETGIAHGTVTVLSGGEPLEITTYRIDGGYSDNRRPDFVEYACNLNEDLARRDFTVNAIAYSPEHGLVDLSSGREDIKSGVIRCVGDAAKRFDEDALRILRALRFAATLDFTIEENTSTAIFEKCALLQNVSPERINNELTKLLCGNGAGRILRDYKQVIAVVIPEIRPMFGFDQRNRHHCYDVWTHTVVTLEELTAVPVLRWAALFHDIGKPSSFSLDKHGEGHFYGHASAGCEIAGTVMRRLRFDKLSRERILLLIKYHDVTIGTDKKQIKRWLTRFGPEFLRQLTALKRADNLAQSENYRERQDKIDIIEEVIKSVIEQQECVTLRDLAVNGDDLLILGYAGKQIGKALRALLEAVIDDKIVNERGALLGYLNELNL